MKSKFKHDLSKEQTLGKYLDIFYQKKYSSKNYSFQRISSLEKQLEGIDLIINVAGKDFLIDEKAQLDYLNKSLPTFAFEISFLKNKKIKLGWLFDKQKKTDTYFLITNIQTNENGNLFEGISNCSMTAVSRKNLIALLEKKGLDEKKIFEYSTSIRQSKKHGKFPIKELDKKKEGFFYYSFENKNEQPINLVLYLNFLTANSQVGKKIR